MTEEQLKNEITKLIRRKSFQFKERQKEIVKVKSFESITLLNLNLVDEKKSKYEFSGVAKVQICDEVTEGGVYLSPSQSQIEGQAIIQNDNEIEIVEPIIIENL